jgi:hypothetical protein
MDQLVLSQSGRTLAGILLLALVTIETGGIYLTRVAQGAVPLTEFQKSFARAGHAHAGVLVILSLVIQLYVDVSGLTGFGEWVARSAVPLAAILMPAGFFFSSMGQGRDKPNQLIWLVWIGALLLAAGVTTLGLGLLIN